MGRNSSPAAADRLDRNRSSRQTNHHPSPLACYTAPSHAPGMFVVSEAEAAAIRAVFQQRGEFAAAIELRRRFPGITDNRRRGSASAPSPAGSRCGR